MCQVYAQSKRARYIGFLRQHVSTSFQMIRLPGWVSTNHQRNANRRCIDNAASDDIRGTDVLIHNISNHLFKSNWFCWTNQLWTVRVRDILSPTCLLLFANWPVHHRTGQSGLNKFQNLKRKTVSDKIMPTKRCTISFQGNIYLKQKNYLKYCRQSEKHLPGWIEIVLKEFRLNPMQWSG